jgi:hypothetical protein
MLFIFSIFSLEPVTLYSQKKSVTITAQALNGSHLPGTTCAMVSLSFSNISGNARISDIYLSRTGTASDLDVPRVHLFKDADQNGIPDNSLIASGDFVTGYANFNSLNKENLSNTIDWIFCFEIDSFADPSRTAGMTIQPYDIIGSGGTEINFSGFWGGDISLPVHLSKFTVLKKPRGALLCWRTESEIDNFFWIIERKALTKEEYQAVFEKRMTVQSSVAPFEYVGQVEGQGTVNTFTDYEFLDETVAEGFYAYRLADVSFSGEITYHQAILLQPDIVPVVYKLYQNFPNPFNPETTIRFLLPLPSYVIVRIFNIQGEEVTELINRDLSEGTHDLTWRGMNANGQTVASGTYICMMKAVSGDGLELFTANQKVVLLK